MFFPKEFELYQKNGKRLVEIAARLREIEEARTVPEFLNAEEKELIAEGSRLQILMTAYEIAHE